MNFSIRRSLSRFLCLFERRALASPKLRAETELDNSIKNHLKVQQNPNSQAKFKSSNFNATRTVQRAHGVYFDGPFIGTKDFFYFWKLDPLQGGSRWLSMVATKKRSSQMSLKEERNEELGKCRNEECKKSEIQNLDSR